MSNNIKDDMISYPNDDYSRFAAADFKEVTHSEIELNLGEEACSLLLRNPLVDASEIILSVHGDALTLKGSVNNQREKNEAEHCLRSLSQVTTVINELQIRR